MTIMQKDDPKTPVWIHLQGAADMLQVSERTIKTLLRDEKWQRKLGAVKIGSQWRFSREQLKNLHREV